MVFGSEKYVWQSSPPCMSLSCAEETAFLSWFIALCFRRKFGKYLLSFLVLRSAYWSWYVCGFCDVMVFLYYLSNCNLIVNNMVLLFMICYWILLIINAGYTWPCKIVSSADIDMVEHEASAPLVTLSVTFSSTI